MESSSEDVDRQLVSETDNALVSESKNNNNNNNTKIKWKFCPREQFVYSITVLIIAFIIGASLYNLSIQSENKELWASTLSFSLAALLPNPKIKKIKHDNPSPI
jgi:Tfp pilus assembly major pilin PilA